MVQPSGIRHVPVVRVVDAGASSAVEAVVVEEPLAIVLDDDTLAVTMRTPGHDRELTLGFLLSEGIIGSVDDVLSLVHCARPGDEGAQNTLRVQLAPHCKPPVDAQGELARRGTLISSACGVCGRRSIDDWLQRFAALPLATPCVDAAILTAAMAELRERQPVFAASGGCHAASLIELGGRALATFEDIGRHNAVDKLVGSRMLLRASCNDHALLVSGRASFEIVQKAIAARIPVVASVSAPSSLAVALAERANVTLLGFVRERRLTAYAAAERLRQR